MRHHLALQLLQGRIAVRVYLDRLRVDGVGGTQANLISVQHFVL